MKKVIRKKYLINFYKNFENDIYNHFKISLNKFYNNPDLKIKSLLKIFLEALCTLDNEFAFNIAEEFCSSKIMEIKLILTNF